MNMCDGDVGASAVRIVPLHERWDLVEACAELLNTQWQRSMGARLHSLRQSSASYPVCLLLLEGERRTRSEKLIGHARVSRVLGSKSLFVESVVVHSELRGRGYGRTLMEGVERFARARGCTRLCLTTHDKQHFYAHLGFVLSRPVQNVGTLASFVPLELLHKFCRTPESEEDRSRGGAAVARHTPPPVSSIPPPPPPPLPPVSKYLSSSVPLPPVSSIPLSLSPSPIPTFPPPPPPLSSLPSVPPPAVAPPPALCTSVEQTLDQTPYTDGRGLPVFWMHKNI